MSININRMGIFQQVAGNGDNIVNLTPNSDGASCRLTTNGKYRWYNPFRGIRKSTTVEQNQQARTQLIKNLFATFGLEESDASFSELRRRLGDDVLRSGNFGYENGRATSNCPLTERRVTAIMNRVRELADAEAAAVPKVTVNEEVINQRQELLVEEVAKPFTEWINGTHNVTYSDNGNPVTLNDVRIYAQNGASRLLAGPFANQVKTMMSTLAKTGSEVRGAVKLEVFRNRVAALTGCGGIVIEPFVNRIVIADGRHVKGGDYLKQLFLEKFDELLAAFNRRHQELAIAD